MARAAGLVSRSVALYALVEYALAQAVSCERKRRTGITDQLGVQISDKHRRFIIGRCEHIPRWVEYSAITEVVELPAGPDPVDPDGVRLVLDGTGVQQPQPVVTA